MFHPGRENRQEHRQQSEFNGIVGHGANTEGGENREQEHGSEGGVTPPLEPQIEKQGQYRRVGQINEPAGHHDALCGPHGSPDQAIDGMQQKGTELLGGIPLINQNLFPPEYPLGAADKVHLVGCIEAPEAPHDSPRAWFFL